MELVKCCANPPDGIFAVESCDKPLEQNVTVGWDATFKRADLCVHRDRISLSGPWNSLMPKKQLSPEEIQGRQGRFPMWQRTAGILGTIALLGSLFLAFFGWGQKVECGGVKILQVFVLAFWTLAPPIWFWAEYVFLFRGAFPIVNQETQENQRRLDDLKTQQDLSSKIWIAATSALLILYFWKDIGGGR